MSGANYNGKQPNNTSYIKTFIEGNPSLLWTNKSFNIIEPLNNDNVYIPGNLYVGGIIINPTDYNIKENISSISSNISDALDSLSCNQYTFKNDLTYQTHYGFDAEEMEDLLPNIVYKTQDNMNYKTINYLEIIPLLVNKIQNMQTQINNLTNELNNIKELLLEEKW
jgi:hypothetical protein